MVDATNVEALKKAAADAADAETVVQMGNIEALLSIYDAAERAAGLEIGLLMVLNAGRMLGKAESAGMTVKIIGQVK